MTAPRPTQPAGTARRAPSIDELVAATEDAKPGPYALVLAATEVAVARLHETLDLFLEAIRNPLAPSAVDAEERLDLDLHGTLDMPELGGRCRSDVFGEGVLDEARLLITSIPTGRAVLSWKGKAAPECPGLPSDGEPTMGCGMPVAKRETLCWNCARIAARGGEPAPIGPMPEVDPSPPKRRKGRKFGTKQRREAAQVDRWRLALYNADNKLRVPDEPDWTFKPSERFAVETLGFRAASRRAIGLLSAIDGALDAPLAPGAADALALADDAYAVLQDDLLERLNTMVHAAQAIRQRGQLTPEDIKESLADGEKRRGELERLRVNRLAAEAALSKQKDLVAACGDLQQEEREAIAFRVLHELKIMQIAHPPRLCDGYHVRDRAPGT